MTLHKVGRFFWLDIYVGGKRIRRSLKTGNKFEALDEYKKVKDKLLAEHRGGDIKFSDFAKKYLDWAWSSKPASADREEQRLKKNREIFRRPGGHLPFGYHSLPHRAAQGTSPRAWSDRYNGILQIVTELNRRGLTVVYATHDGEEAARLCHRVALIDQGRIVALDTPRALQDVRGGGLAALENLDAVFVELTGKQPRG